MGSDGPQRITWGWSLTCSSSIKKLYWKDFVVSRLSSLETPNHDFLKWVFVFYFPPFDPKKKKSKNLLILTTLVHKNQMRVDAFSLSCNRTENMRALRWLVYLFCFIGVKMVDINKKVCIRGKAEQTMKTPRALSIRFTQVPTAPPQVFQVLWFHVIPPKKKKCKSWTPCPPSSSQVPWNSTKNSTKAEPNFRETKKK